MLSNNSFIYYKNMLLFISQNLKDNIMYTYHNSFIGFTISIDMDHVFFKHINEVISEFDYRNVSEFNIEDLNEILEKSSFDEYDEACIELAKSFFVWIEAQNDKFELQTAYHGSLDTPIYLPYRLALSNNKLKKHHNQTNSFCINLSTLKDSYDDALEFKAFCQLTMPTELFKFFDQRDLFGLNFVSCSS